MQTDQEAADADLISRYRGGDESAAGELYARHHQAVWRLAVSIAGRSDADDLASEAFVRVFAAIRNGHGPEVAFRAYIMTTVRNAFVNGIRRDSRYVWVEDYTGVEGRAATDDGAGLRMESSLLAQAFSTLPERWQAVLWHTAIENESHGEVGRLLGIKPAAVAALSYRAREGLRQAYLAAHLAETSDLACRQTRERLPAYVREQLGARAHSEVEAHLDECHQCTAVLADLRGVTSALGAVLAPALLGAAATSYLSTRPGGRSRRPRRPRVPRSLVAAGAAVAAVAATVVAAAAVSSDSSDTAVLASLRPPTAIATPDAVEPPAAESPNTPDEASSPVAPELQWPPVVDPVPRAEQPRAADDPSPRTNPTPRPTAPTRVPRTPTRVPTTPVGTQPTPPTPSTEPTPPTEPEPPTGTTFDQQLTAGATTVAGDAGIFEMDVSSPDIAPVLTVDITSTGGWSFDPNPPGATCTSSSGGSSPTTVVCTFAEAYSGALTLVLTGQTAGMAFTATVDAPGNTDPVPSDNTIVQDVQP
ncbi:sigma-70 family RNA polymerase sigma factor [Aeromicrobium fastidiosum]|uniref:Sigma-70 family RNA polymerase sigma factor n=1 Tax=Aeromicrobium fastidiosum TaxID=52699 RepID=A0A641AQT2_9ACTN|nr:sigma-70 family RNA polymerase sigma factor [Aeromicrobium fastidiosum]KAA1380305.1 sigma-70 family RNA polymerase sigma factor [Aeromicrobium fastidiosum]MBP2389860.1 RNA polymerase sigma factor (sigma-70 family) [Aeromicrobium fastidiosum]